jgi:hypothetical protein
MVDIEERRYLWTGAARSSFSSSTSIMAATLVTGFGHRGDPEGRIRRGGIVWERSRKPTARR